MTDGYRENSTEHETTTHKVRHYFSKRLENTFAHFRSPSSLQTHTLTLETLFCVLTQKSMHESSSLLLKASQWVLRDTVPATPRVHFPKPSTYPNVIASAIQIHPQQSWHEIFTFKLPPSLQNNESVASLTHCSHKQAPRRVCRGQAVCFACLFFLSFFT